MSHIATSKPATNEMRPAPHPGFVLVARRRLNANGLIYDVGCALEPAALGKNYQALLDARFVMWQPGQVGSAQPRAAPPPAPPRKNPEVKIIFNSDPVASRRKTIERLASLCDGDWGRAVDLFVMDPLGAKLDILATRVGAERDARANNRVGRRIPPNL